MSEPSIQPFLHLDIGSVLDEVEYATGRRASSLCRPLNSYINRVYDVTMDEGDPVVIKFYRPGRWSHDALQDEHDFLLDLAEAEVPVIAPMADEDGETLHERDGMYYALFPKKGGRIVDEPTGEQWIELGRLLGRMHQVGRDHDAPDRIVMTPTAWTREQAAFLRDGGFIDAGARPSWERVVEALLNEIEPLFDGVRLQRIHGDLHMQNLIHRPDEGFLLIDFDDMAMGPPMQDWWMLLPGRAKDCPVELDHLREGYTAFSRLDAGQLRLIEPLRAMRYLHFCAWCAHQVGDGGATRVDPDWGSSNFWHGEVRELENQLDEIRRSLDHEYYGW